MFCSVFLVCTPEQPVGLLLLLHLSKTSGLAIVITVSKEPSTSIKYFDSYEFENCLPLKNVKGQREFAIAI